MFNLRLEQVQESVDGGFFHLNNYRLSRKLCISHNSSFRHAGWQTRYFTLGKFHFFYAVWLTASQRFNKNNKYLQSLLKRTWQLSVPFLIPLRSPIGVSPLRLSSKDMVLRFLTVIHLKMVLEIKNAKSSKGKVNFIKRRNKYATVLMNFNVFKNELSWSIREIKNLFKFKEKQCSAYTPLRIFLVTPQFQLPE